VLYKSAESLNLNRTLVIVKGYETPDFSVLFNNGDGTFQSVVPYDIENVKGRSICISELNGDGYNDIVLTGECVWILFGNGDGTFQDPVSYDFTGCCGAIRALDLDGDGDIDLATAADGVSILINNGDGTFQDPIACHLGWNPGSFCMSDFDSDGDFDIGLLSEDKVGIWINHADQATATMLRSFTTTLRDDGIEIMWSLSSAGSFMDFLVFRAENADDHLLPITAGIERLAERSYRCIDRTCRPGAPYRYRVIVMDDKGSRMLFETGIIEIPYVSFHLNQNVPNPFNPVTTISYYIPERTHVTLDIFSVGGQLIVTLVDKVQKSGNHVVQWNGCEENGNIVASGVYFYRLRAGKQSVSRKMVLLR
jgi:hypothetical protein